MIVMIVYMVVLCFLLDSRVNAMQCRSQNGAPVDWFVVYKLPEIPGNHDSRLRKGVAYQYMDDQNPTLTLSEADISETRDNPLYNTLNYIYRSNTSEPISYVLYNDQIPGKISNSHGHTKGVLGFDKKSGFWLVHSLPRFPPKVSIGLSFKGSSLRNGQTFLCVSIPYWQIDSTVGTIFRYNFPFVYDKNFPPEFYKNNTILKAILLGKRRDDLHVTKPPWQKVVKVKTLHGQTFFAFAKFRNFGRDLYDGFLSDQLKDALLVQTWRTSKTPGDNLPSNCSIPYKVYDINSLNFKGQQIQFRTTKDHSKWAITKTKGNWLCIGDINRAKSQFLRPGGQVCFQNKQSWTSFKAVVADIDNC